MTEAAFIKELIEQTSENTARRIAEEMRKDISKSFERIGRLELAVGIGEGNGNGLKLEVLDIRKGCAARLLDCQTVHNSLRMLATIGTQKIKTWHLLAVGAVSGATSTGAILLFILKVAEGIKK